MTTTKERLKAVESAARVRLRGADVRSAGAALIEAMSGPDLQARLRSLLVRLEAGIVTEADCELLNSLPPHSDTPRDLVRRFVRINDIV
jgi:hypothetical protein